MVEAYSALDNSGVKVVPYSIRYISDNEGNVLWEAEDLGRSKRVLSERKKLIFDGRGYEKCFQIWNSLQIQQHGKILSW